MKADSIVFAVAGMCFGVILGWVLGTQQAGRTAMAPVQQAAGGAGAGNEQARATLDEARVQSLTTILTSVTGFLFPADTLLPSHVFGIISLVVLALAMLGLYVFRLGGAWRPVYVVTAAIALYLNSFVGVVQAFQKLPFLNPLAPTQSEPPFFAAQIVVLAIFVLLGFRAVRAFHPDVTLSS